MARTAPRPVRSPGVSAQSGALSWMAWLSVSALIILADQFTKVLIVGFFQVGEAHPVTGFFRLIRVHNAGAAFSMLADASGWQRWFFIGFGVAAALFVVWMLRTHGAQKLFAFALACVLGGAVGNVIDRIVYGHVIDFLDFHWAGVHFPAFNVADSAITVGAALLLLDEFLRVRRQR